MAAPLAWLLYARLENWPPTWTRKRRGRPTKPIPSPHANSPFYGTFGFSPEGMTHDPAPVPRHNRGQPQDIGTDLLIRQVLDSRPNFRANKAKLVQAVQREQEKRGLPIDAYKALYNRIERLPETPR